MNETTDIPDLAKPPEPANEAVLNLKAAREARGFSLHDVFHATRVSSVNLEALESWDFDQLPPPIYTRNFIRKYAQAIGVDARPILDRYQLHLDSIEPRRDIKIKKTRPRRRYYFILFGMPIMAIVTGILLYPLDLHDQFSKLFLPARSGEPPHPGLALPTEPSATGQTNPPPAPSPIVETTTVAGMATPRPEERAALPLPTDVTEKRLHLIIEAKELTWIRITEDHDSPSQVLLKPGGRIERRASDFFLLDVGNAGGIDLIFQGKPLGSIGKRGQVTHLRLPDKERER